MRLRYRGVCRSCGADLAAGTYAMYDRPNRSVRCIECPAGAALHGGPAAGIPEVQENEHVRGSAGDSARREFERRKSAREARVRGRYPRLGGLLLALSEDPQSTRAWASGADGERRLGRHLDSASGPLLRVLHDRRVPGSRANIDHVAIAPSGVFVIDAKKYWPLIGGDFQTRGVHVLWPKKLTSVLAKPGPLTESHIATIHQHLARTMPSA